MLKENECKKREKSYERLKGRKMRVEREDKKR